MDTWIANKGKGHIWDKRKQKRKMLQFTDLYQWMFSPGEDGVRSDLGRRTLGCLWKRSSIWLSNACSNSKSNCILGCVKEMRPIGKGGDSARLLCSSETPPGGMHPTLKPLTQNLDLLEWVQQRPLRWSKTGWDAWRCSTWRKEGPREM